MTPEEKSLLERTLKLSEENNNILRKMRRSARISSLFHIFYWVVIIGLSVGSYYFIEPYFSALPNLMNAVQGDQTSTNSALQQIQSLLQMK